MLLLMGGVGDSGSGMGMSSDEGGGMGMGRGMPMQPLWLMHIEPHHHRAYTDYNNSFPTHPTAQAIDRRT